MKFHAKEETLASIDATSSAIGFFVNSAAVATQRALLEREEMKTLRDDLTGQIASPLSDFNYVRQRKRKLVWQLGLWIIPLQLINLVIFAVPVIVLILGPARLTAYVPGLQTTPLSFAAKTALWLWLLISGIGYLALCCVPTFRLVCLLRRTNQWLANHPRAQR